MGQDPVPWLAGTVRVLMKKVEFLEQFGLPLPDASCDLAGGSLGLQILDGNRQVEKSDVQDMIEQAWSSQFTEISRVLREVMANALTKGDLEEIAKLSIVSNEQLKKELKAMGERVSTLEAMGSAGEVPSSLGFVNDFDVHDMIEEAWTSQFAQIVGVLRETMEKVTKQKDLEEFVASSNGKVQQLMQEAEALRTRLSMLEVGAASRKEGLRRRIDKTDGLVHDLQSRLIRVEDMLEEVEVVDGHDGKDFGDDYKNGQTAWPQDYHTQQLEGKYRVIFVKEKVISAIGLWGQVHCVGIAHPDLVIDKFGPIEEARCVTHACVLVSEGPLSMDSHVTFSCSCRGCMSIVFSAACFVAVVSI